jgi:hypothetical protein
VPNPEGLRADSHIPCRFHAVPLPFTLATASEIDASDNKLSGTGCGSSKGHKLESHEHAVNMPSPAVALRGRLQKGTLVAWQGNGMGTAWHV